MRYLIVFLVFFASCSVPEGLPQNWPPGPEITAIAASDLDGDGVTDVVAFGQGLYALFGGSDIQPHAGPIDSFSAYRPTEFSAEAALIVRDSLGALVLAAHGDRGNTRIDVFDGEELHRLGSFLVPGGPCLGMWTLALDQDYLVVADVSSLHVIAVDFLRTPSSVASLALTPPLGGWNNPLLAFVYGSTAVVATESSIYRSPVRDTVIDYLWDPVRQGEPWLVQAPADLNNDGRPEILGYRNSPSPGVCAIDVENPSELACLPVAAIDGEPTLVVAPLESPGRWDLFLTREQIGEQYEFRSNLRLGGGALTGSAVTPGFLQGLGREFTIVWSSPERVAPRLILVDETGAFHFCFQSENAMLVGCQ